MLCQAPRFVTPQSVEFSNELIRKFLEEPRVHEVFLEAVEDRRLQYVASDVDPVVAGSGVSGCGTAEEIGTDLRVTAPAGATFHEAGKQILRPAAVPVGSQRISPSEGA